MCATGFRSCGSNEARDSRTDRGETVVELMYRAQVGRFFVVQPDLQWVMNPGMYPDVTNAISVRAPRPSPPGVSGERSQSLIQPDSHEGLSRLGSSRLLLLNLAHFGCKFRHLSEKRTHDRRSVLPALQHPLAPPPQPGCHDDGQAGVCHPAGEVTHRHRAFYARRAQGGVGLLTTEPLYVQMNGRELPTQMGVHGDALTSGFRISRRRSMPRAGGSWPTSTTRGEPQIPSSYRRKQLVSASVCFTGKQGGSPSVGS